jgi:hypothetical protein
MNLRHFIVSLAALSALACSSTQLHPVRPSGSYAVVVSPVVFAQAEPLIAEMRGRFEKLDVLTDAPNAQSRYSAVIVLKPAGTEAGKTAFAYVVTRSDLPPQKGAVSITGQTVAGLDRLVDYAGAAHTLSLFEQDSHFSDRATLPRGFR